MVYQWDRSIFMVNRVRIIDFKASGTVLDAGKSMFITLFNGLTFKKNCGRIKTINITKGYTI